MKANGVKHIRSAPFHPSTNGLAERFVQTFKHSLKRSKGTTSVQHRLDAFLLSYRNTPHSTTKESPAMLFVRRKLRSRLDILRPSTAATVESAQDAQCARRQKRAKARSFAVGDTVLVRNYGRGEKWTPGVVAAETGPVSYAVDIGSSEQWRRHADQILAQQPQQHTPRGDADSSALRPDGSPVQHPAWESTPDPDQQSAEPVSVPATPCGTPKVTSTPSRETARRYPSRVSKPTVRYSP